MFTEDDSSYCVDISSTKDGKFITVNSNSRTTSEEGTCLYNFPFSSHVSKFLLLAYLNLGGFIQVFVIDASNPQEGLRRLCKRVPGVQYFVEHHGGFFYVLTNASLSEDKELSTGNYYLGRVRVEDAHLNNWQVNYVFFCPDMHDCISTRFPLLL